MKELNSQELTIVAGGKSKNTELTSALTNIQSSIKDLGSQNNNKSNDLLLPMVMMMALNKPQPTVVAAGAPAAAPTSVVNISTRVRRFW
jgi:hypothetical protein